MRKSEPFYPSDSTAPEPFLDPRADENLLFTVTQVIGNVYKGGNFPPHEVAFQLIARNGQDGTFVFPNEDGTTVEVTVLNLRP